MHNDNPTRSISKGLHAAIVGSGAAGLFAAESLLALDPAVRVDVFERLTEPYGLVRYGIAPDHPRTRGVITKLATILAHDHLRLFTNVHVGRDITVDELRAHYRIILFATGAIEDRNLDIPGERLAGSYPAIEFVGWYNGHPDFRDRSFSFETPSAVVLGNGNVALDVTRILAKSAAELHHTDISPAAIAALERNPIQTIYLVGRRGPVQSSFSYKDLLELTELKNCSVHVDAADLELNDASRQELEAPSNRFARQNYELLRKHTDIPKQGKQIIVMFLRGPVALTGAVQVEGITLGKNRLDGGPHRQTARDTGAREHIPCGLVFRSIGFRGAPIAGVPFDTHAGIFANTDGRIQQDGQAVQGLYAAGWIRRGANGLIGDNKRDATTVVKHIVDDLPRLPSGGPVDRSTVDGFLRDKGLFPRRVSA